MNLKKIISIIRFSLNVPIWLLSKVIKPKKYIWVFGAWFGKKYGDNSKYLFEYVNKSCPDIKAIWLATEDDTVKLVRSKGYRAYKTFSFKGYLYSLIAAYGFVSTGFGDINFFPTANMKMINLWHGSGGLKKCMMDDDISGKSSEITLYKKLKNFFFPFANERYYTTITTSEVMVKILSSAFRTMTQRVDLIGQPRCDSFYNEPPQNELNKILAELKNKNQMIGIYMPTHRKEGRFDFVKFIQDELENLNQKIKELNIVLLIKLHFYHLESLRSLSQNFSNIIFVRDEDIEQDIYSILPMTDFLISDYSSIYADYLHLKKPIVFFPFDKNDYIKSDRDFYMDYDEVTPGEKVYNWKELYECMQDLARGIDNYKEERQKILDLFNLYQDGRNSERVVKWIKNIEEKGV